MLQIKNNKGVVQLPVLVGLLIMAIALPVASRLSQINQDNRNKAVSPLSMPDETSPCLKEGISNLECAYTPGCVWLDGGCHPRNYATSTPAPGGPGTGTFVPTNECRYYTSSTGVKYWFCGALTNGEPCEPAPGTGDYCMRNGVSVTCASIGRIRCQCNNGNWVIGSNNITCDQLCGFTGNVCVNTACNPGTSITVPPSTLTGVVRPTSTSMPTPTRTTAPTSSPSPTRTPSPTRRPTATPTRSPAKCGYRCSTSSPCDTGLICTYTSTGSRYCSLPANLSRCNANPNLTTCCSTLATATPTRRPTATPTRRPTTTPTRTPTRRPTATPTRRPTNIPCRWVCIPVTTPTPTIDLKKPAIYLYPTKETEVEVKVAVNGNISNSIPEYREGWKVTAKPNGVIDGKYDYLFYEAALNEIVVPDDGWVVEYNNLNKWFDDKLPELGLNQKEREQFAEYWLATLPEANYYTIKLLSDEYLQENVRLEIFPKPKTVIRRNFVFRPMDTGVSLSEPRLTVTPREGFTVVEWGGIIDER